MVEKKWLKRAFERGTVGPGRAGSSTKPATMFVNRTHSDRNNAFFVFEAVEIAMVFLPRQISPPKISPDDIFAAINFVAGNFAARPFRHGKSLPHKICLSKKIFFLTLQMILSKKEIVEKNCGIIFFSNLDVGFEYEPKSILT